MRKRVLCLDYGEKNIGVAVSDPFGWTAQGLCVLRRDSGDAVKPIIARISVLLKQYDTNAIVLGYPRNMDGTIGASAQKVMDFKLRLERAIPGLTVTLWDERLSTVSAIRSLGGSKNKKDLVDEIAAVFILQNYLDYKSKEHKMNDRDELINDDDFEDDINDEFELETVILTGEDGEEVECVVLDSCEYGGKTYLLVIDADEDEDEDGTAYILKEVKQDDDTYVYESIADDDEFDKIAAIFGEENDEFEIEQ